MEELPEIESEYKIPHILQERLKKLGMPQRTEAVDPFQLDDILSKLDNETRNIQTDRKEEFLATTEDDVDVTKILEQLYTRAQHLRNTKGKEEPEKMDSRLSQQKLRDMNEINFERPQGQMQNTQAPSSNRDQHKKRKSPPQEREKKGDFKKEKIEKDTKYAPSDNGPIVHKLTMYPDEKGILCVDWDVSNPKDGDWVGLYYGDDFPEKNKAITSSNHYQYRYVKKQTKVNHFNFKTPYEFYDQKYHIAYLTRSSFGHFKCMEVFEMAPPQHSLSLHDGEEGPNKALVMEWNNHQQVGYGDQVFLFKFKPAIDTLHENTKKQKLLSIFVKNHTCGSYTTNIANDQKSTYYMAYSCELQDSTYKIVDITGIAISFKLTDMDSAENPPVVIYKNLKLSTAELVNYGTDHSYKSTSSLSIDTTVKDSYSVSNGCQTGVSINLSGKVPFLDANIGITYQTSKTTTLGHEESIISKYQTSISVNVDPQSKKIVRATLMQSNEIKAKFKAKLWVKYQGEDAYEEKVQKVFGSYKAIAQKIKIEVSNNLPLNDSKPNANNATWETIHVKPEQNDKKPDAEETEGASPEKQIKL